jgi:hypothetical protein
VAEPAFDGAEGCESDGCCAVALTETSSAAVKIHFEVRMTILSKSLNRCFFCFFCFFGSIPNLLS